MRRASTILTLAIALLAAPLAARAAEPPQRPAADLARDADRKPQAMVAFARLRAGQTVVDILPGSGYFTRVFSDAVGPKGKVIAIVPTMLAEAKPDAVTVMKALASEPGRENVELVVQSLRTIAPAGSADVVWTSQNYHDLHGPMLPPTTLTVVNKAIFDALKPGGIYVVVDHAAAPGSGLRDVATLHRIDPATVKAEVLAAGFTFDGESKALENPADDHSRKVFDPAIRGHTDQFVYRFRKPG